MVYQNVYFRGASPFVFYRNRNVNFYGRRYQVRPIYRNVNINVYKVNRGNFKEGFRAVGRNQNMIQPNRNDGMRTQPIRSGANGNNIGGTRNSQIGGIRTENNSGIRNQGGVRNGNENIRTQSAPAIKNEGTRNQNNRIRQNQNSIRKSEVKSNGGQRNASPKSDNGSRSSGMRLTSR
ncbi:hypothetical protein D3C87_1035960 [compost metagenome]